MTAKQAIEGLPPPPEGYEWGEITALQVDCMPETPPENWYYVGRLQLRRRSQVVFSNGTTTATLTLPEAVTTWPVRATAVTDPNGYFVLPLAGYNKCRIEVINGSETVTIQGDEIEVETVEMARAKRLAARRSDDEAYRRQTPWWRRILESLPR